MALIELRDVGFHYPDSTTSVLHSVSLSAEVGDMISIEGRNGTGKSTLLKLISGELSPTRGAIHRGLGRAIYLDQTAGDMLAPSLTLTEHAMAFAHGPNSPRNINDRMNRALSGFSLGLEHRDREFAGSLSGGQRQIFAFLTTLLADARIICLDEFTSSLDPVSEAAVLRVLVSFLDSKSAAVFISSHREIGLKPTRILTLDRRGLG